MVLGDFWQHIRILPLFSNSSLVDSSTRFLIKSYVLFDHGMIPLGGSFPLGPELVFLVKAPILSGKQILLSYLVFLGLAASHVDSHPTWFAMYLVPPSWTDL